VRSTNAGTENGTTSDASGHGRALLAKALRASFRILRLAERNEAVDVDSGGVLDGGESRPCSALLGKTDGERGRAAMYSATFKGARSHQLRRGGNSHCARPIL